MTQKTNSRILVDTNKHGIRREYPAVGYRAAKKFNKKKKKYPQDK